MGKPKGFIKEELQKEDSLVDMDLKCLEILETFEIKKQCLKTVKTRNKEINKFIKKFFKALKKDIPTPISKPDSSSLNNLG